MKSPTDAVRQKALAAAFKMPSMQKIMSRKTSITNAFVCAVIPVLHPSLSEIEEASIYSAWTRRTCMGLTAGTSRASGTIFALWW